MNYHAKRKLMQGSLYITLALVICTIMCLTVVAFVSAKRPKKTVDPAVPDKIETQTESEGPNEGASLLPTPQVTPDLPTGSDDSPTYVLPADGYVLKGFSMDMPVWSLTMEDYRTHSGIDVSAACGSAVYAMTGGVITDISEHPLMGTSMTVIQDDSHVAVYSNLASELPEGIAEGATVSAGQVIASVGDTSLIESCDTDHLHLELYTPAGECINPETKLDFSGVAKQDTGIE